MRKIRKKTKGKKLRKTLVIGTIILFVGSCFFPTIDAKMLNYPSLEAISWTVISQDIQILLNLNYMRIDSCPISDCWSMVPSIVVSDNGDVHVVWLQRLNFNDPPIKVVLYLKKSASEDSWPNNPMVISSVGASVTDPDIAIGPDNTIHVVWSESGDILYRKKPLGDAWQDTILISNMEDTEDYYFIEAFNPSIAVGPAGTAHIAWQQKIVDDGWPSPNSNPIYYSSDLYNWQYPERVSDPANDYYYVETDDKPSLDVDGYGSVHIAWHRYRNSEIDPFDRILYKTNSIYLPWLNVEKVFISPEGMYADHPSLAVEPDGTAHVTWDDFTGDSPATTNIYYSTNDDGWSTIEVVSTESPDNIISKSSSIGVEPDGTVHVIWEDNINGIEGDNKDIYYKKKTSDGWGNSVIRSTGDGMSKNPSLAVELDGTVHIVYQDNADLNGVGEDYDIFYIPAS
jgi:hypothetical protein